MYSTQKQQPVCILICLSLSNQSFSVASHPHLCAHLSCLFSSAAVISALCLTFIFPYRFRSSFYILSISFSFTVSSQLSISLKSSCISFSLFFFLFIYALTILHQFEKKNHFCKCDVICKRVDK